MGLIEAIQGGGKVIVPSPLNLETLRMMGMVKKDASGRYVLVVPSLDDSDKGDEPEDA